MIKKITSKKIQLVLALATAFVLAASFYFQYVTHLDPCPLCLMQRYCIFLLLFLIAVSFVTSNKSKWVYLLQFFVACFGIFFALRQVWLQMLPPDRAPSCMPDLHILIRYFPWQAVFHTLFWGAGDCAKVTWRMLGLSMPVWSAFYFLFIQLMSAYLWIKAKRGTKQ